MGDKVGLLACAVIIALILLVALIIGGPRAVASLIGGLLDD